MDLWLTWGFAPTKWEIFVPSRIVIERYITTYWGKARPEVGVCPVFHPLAYHSLDVAAVGQALFAARPSYRSTLAAIAGIPEPTAEAWFMTALAWHDLGKFSDGFQAKAPEALLAIGRTMEIVTDHGHAPLTMRLWQEHLFELAISEGWYGQNINRRQLSGTFQWFLAAAAGHHGKPVFELDCQIKDVFPGSVLKDATDFACASTALFPPLALPQGRMNSESFRSASWLVSGLGVLCDWLGSNTRWFQYHAPTLSLEEYWHKIARPNAACAIREAGLRASHPNKSVAAIELLPPDATGMSPLQDFAATTPVGAEPQIFILEDLTGAGKTEAALILARRMMAQGAAEGVYFALPTMATANAMYERLDKLLPQLYEPGQSPTLALLHGKSKLRHALVAAERSAPDRQYDGEASATRLMTAWLSDDRRKAFWADIGVGTIDQALLAVLPAKFQSLRLAGLARKVLIVDEAHAYEPFTFGEMKALLSFHAALGGSGIILSATLPSKGKQALLEAFKKPLTPDQTGLDGPISEGYPLATGWNKRCGLAQTSIAPAMRSIRTLNVVRACTVENALALTLAQARDGKRVCRLVNTVDDAIEAYEALRHASGTELPIDLFHARFAFVDRRAKETRCLADFGKIRDAPIPSGRILVATQVVEQSLDLDFDVMITDLAPIDALIQRAGRLWRHARPEREGMPTLHVVMPEPVEDAKENWYAAMFKRAAYVYKNHEKLWRTAWLLHDTPALRFPDDARRLVEAVYGETFPVTPPAAFEKKSRRAEGDARAEASQGTGAALKLSEGYSGTAGWDDESKILTRLGEEQKVYRLAKWENGGLRPWADDVDEWLAWRLSEIAIPVRKLSEQSSDSPEMAKAMAAARAQWPDKEYGPEIFMLKQVGEKWKASGRTKNNREIVCIYSNECGLRFESFD